MSNTITRIILNFKETLKNNYYHKNKEKDEFLQWLESNITYKDGICSIREEKIITETEQTDTINGNDRLKNLVKSWSRSRPEKQEYWDTQLKQKLSYYNGKFCLDSVDDKYTPQDVSGEVEFEIMDNGKYYYSIMINTSPFVEGQHFGFTPSFTVYRTYSIINNYYLVEIVSDRKITEPVTLYADPILKGDVLYGGGSVVVNPINP